MITALGAVVGLVGATGLLLVIGVLLARRHTSMDVRVFAYLTDLPQSSGFGRVAPGRASGVDGALKALVAPALGVVGNGIERVLGGADSIRRRLIRANLDLDVHEFRIQQALWGLAGFTLTAVPAALLAALSPQRAVPLFLCCLAAGALGVLLRENRLSSQVRTRERMVLEEFPVVAELLALSVAAGEAPVAALTRVTQRCHGALADDLRAMLAAIRTGTPLATAFDELGARSGLPAVTRFAEGMAIAIERGTPMADVLHAQAGDVREASRRQLIEVGARKEVAMMIPVVFIVLPVVIVFAFFPGLIGLRLVV